MLYVLDASSILWAWDTMPAEKTGFAEFWAWVGEELQTKRLCMPQTAFDEVKNQDKVENKDEVKNKALQCSKFLKDNNVQIFPLTNQIVETALDIKAKLGIENDKYNSKGVCENDLFIIAHAYLLYQDDQEVTLLSDEKEQPNLPDNPKNFKIPAVCSEILKPSMPCLNFRIYMGKEMPNNNE